MSKYFRVDYIELETTGGTVAYELTGPLTVLDGPVATGKSTLIELIKHGLGGSARFSPVVKEHISSVTLRIAAGAERLALRRATHSGVNDVHAFDLRSREALGVFPAEARGKAEVTIGQILLTALGLPADVRASALSSRATSKPSVVTFNDIWSSLYVE